MKTILKGQMPRVSATMIVYAQDGIELTFPSENDTLQVGDLVLLEKGKHIPADTKILVGEIVANHENNKEEIFGPKSIAIGGWLITSGSAKGYVFAKAEESQLALL